MQGALIDGTKGVAYAKPTKAAKYLVSLLEVVRQGRANRKQVQMLAGGLVYLFSFRRPLMSCLNSVWEFIVKFDNDRITKPLPRQVTEEFVASFFLSGVSYMNFRLGVNEVVTASDASEDGGGLCQSLQLTEQGAKASVSAVRGEIAEEEPESGLLIISCFDTIGSVRVAMDSLKAPVTGYISIDPDPHSSRVVEASFPTCDFVSDIAHVSLADIMIWAGKYPNCSGVLVSGAPPNETLLDTICQIFKWAQEVFTWCPVHILVESVSNLDRVARCRFSKSVGLLPYLFDSKGVSLCKRPRLWWFDWNIQQQEGLDIFPPSSIDPSDYGVVEARGQVDPSGLLSPGWKMTNSAQRFSTFTPSQPKALRPGNKPPGWHGCSLPDLQKWEGDRFRFPPHTYRFTNGVVHKKKGWRLLTIEEKEVIMGYPRGFTLHASTKSVRKNHPLEADDVRMSLVGRSWHVGVVCLLLQDLLHKLKIAQRQPIQCVLDRLRPGVAESLSGFLFRPAMGNRMPFRTSTDSLEQRRTLVENLCHLVSSKGSDVLLTAGTEPLPSTHRFRTSIPRGLWHWAKICGWRWQHHTPEHINKLELKAVYTSLKWRVARQRLRNSKMLHLVDSMVSLQVLNKGRSSSHKLRRITKKCCALLIASRLFLILAYIDTKQNPADRPSRRPTKRKWASAK